MNFAKIVSKLLVLFFLVHVKIPWGDDKTYRASAVEVMPGGFSYKLTLHENGRTVYVPCFWTIAEER